MCWKLSSLLCMEFLPCKKNPGSALSCCAASPPSAVGRCFPGDLQRFVSDEQRFLTLRSGELMAELL